MKRFNLIELMVVIAILAIIVSILLPSLRRAREVSKTAVCKSNISQMNRAFLTYTRDDSNRLFNRSLTPPNRDGRKGEFWTHRLEPYFGTLDLIKCPSVNHEWDGIQGGHYFGNAKEGWGAVTGNSFVHIRTGEATHGSYGMNGFLYKDFKDGSDREIGENADNEFYNNFYEIEDHAKTPLFTDMVWVDAWPRFEDQNPVTMDGTTSDRRIQLGRVFIDRHYSEKMNLGFVDGSARTIQSINVLMFDWNKAKQYRKVW